MEFIETDVVVAKVTNWICVECLHEVDIQLKRHKDIFSQCEIRSMGKFNVAPVINPIKMIMTKVFLEKEENTKCTML